MFLLPMVETKPSFDRDRDFMPVSLLTRFEFCVAIGPAVDAKDFAGLVAKSPLLAGTMAEAS